MFPIYHLARLVLLLSLLDVAAFAADYVFVVDTSGSMTETISRKDRRIRITTVQDAMRVYLTAIPADSRVTLISFNSGIASEREMVLRADADRQDALQWVNQLDAEARKNGDTHLWSTLRRALQVAVAYSKQNAEQTVLVRVLTDGQDTEKRYTLEQVLAEFPDVNGKAIRANLVLLGDLEIPLRVKRDGFDIVHDPNFSVMFPPVIRWAPMPSRVDQDISFFDNSQSAYQFYEWRIDGMLVGQQKSVTARFTKAGEHLVHLVVTGTAGTKDSSSVRVTVLEVEKEEPMAPSFVFSPATPEPGQAVRFFGRSSGRPVGYSWQIGGQEFATTNDAERTFPQEGTFELRFVVRDAKGNVAEKTQTLSVVEPVVAVQFKAASEVGSGQAVQFVNETIGRVSSFKWDFGDGQKSSERNPTHVFRNEGNTPTIVRVVLGVDMPTGKSFSSQPLNISILPPNRAPAPQALFRVLGEQFKVGTLVQFMDESTGRIDSYSWDFGGEGSSTNKNPEFRFDTPGSKAVTLRVRGPGGESPTAKTVTVLKPALSIVLNWIDPEGKSCPPPDKIVFGDIAPQHVKNQQYIPPLYDTFEMVVPDDLPAAGGAVITLEGKAAEVCEVLRVFAGGEKTFPISGVVHEPGRFRLTLKTPAREGDFSGSLVVRPHGNDVLLNQQPKSIAVPIQLSIGAPGGNAGLFVLLLLVVAGSMVAWRLIANQPLRYPIVVSLREVSMAPKGAKADENSTARPSQDIELARIAEKIDFGRDAAGSSGAKVFDINAPGFFLMGQKDRLSLHSRSGGKPQLLKKSDEITVKDTAGKARCVRVDVRPKPSPRPAQRKPKK